MFKSQLSGKQYGPKMKPVRIVTAYRDRTYVQKDGTVSQGTEIVKELEIGQDEYEQMLWETKEVTP